MSPPLPPKLRALLARQGPEAVARVEQSLHASLRPCLWVKSKRVSQAPLHRGPLARMLSLRVAAPRLPLLSSKLGGMSYATADLAPRRGQRFLGQLHLAELPQCIPELPRQGLLAIDLGPEGSFSFHSRWYPRPSEAAAVTPEDVRAVGQYEAALQFRRGDSLPRGEEWTALLQGSNPELLDSWNAWEPEGFFLDERDSCHRLGGHRSLDLDAVSRFTPPPGGPTDVGAYEQLLRLTFDNAAGFAWGTNWVYLLIHQDDLREERLDRVGFAIANA
ncbi:DUF1963 domain-containing protein [Pyxidicoccus caerfyrddinensis]|uniref:DUF1963 domain-containing protein n=1 Tax=Pyxidicoccus caerfyrddinensis TaxID=2709663 RepID=UPI001F078266|nr:DUF1963 domain-containing protein [Pyxidicoccus caerfyrddinensis]